MRKFMKRKKKKIQLKKRKRKLLDQLRKDL
jgi:hypothetical protein